MTKAFKIASVDIFVYLHLNFAPLPLQLLNFSALIRRGYQTDSLCFQSLIPS